VRRCEKSASERRNWDVIEVTAAGMFVTGGCRTRKVVNLKVLENFMKPLKTKQTTKKQKLVKHEHRNDTCVIVEKPA
jgi:hypothetical protein